MNEIQDLRSEIKQMNSSISLNTKILESLIVKSKLASKDRILKELGFNRELAAKNRSGNKKSDAILNKALIDKLMSLAARLDHEELVTDLEGKIKNLMRSIADKNKCLETAQEYFEGLKSDVYIIRKSKFKALDNPRRANISYFSDGGLEMMQSSLRNYLAALEMQYLVKEKINSLIDDIDELERALESQSLEDSGIHELTKFDKLSFDLLEYDGIPKNNHIQILTEKLKDKFQVKLYRTIELIIQNKTIWTENAVLVRKFNKNYVNRSIDNQPPLIHSEMFDNNIN